MIVKTHYLNYIAKKQRKRQTHDHRYVIESFNFSVKMVFFFIKTIFQTMELWQNLWWGWFVDTICVAVGLWMSKHCMCEDICLYLFELYLNLIKNSLYVYNEGIYLRIIKFLHYDEDPYRGRIAWNCSLGTVRSWCSELTEIFTQLMPSLLFRHKLHVLQRKLYLSLDVRSTQNGFH